MDIERTQLNGFILRAGFTYGFDNLESWARRMAERAVQEINALQALSVTNILLDVVPGDGDGDGLEIYAQSPDDVVKLLSKLYDQAEALRDALQEAVRTLRRYEELHRAKNTPDSLAKAEANATLAARFERTLSTLR